MRVFLAWIAPSLAILALSFPPACLAEVRADTRVRVSILERKAAPDSLFLAAGFEPGSRLVGTFVGADSSAITIDDQKGIERTIPHEVVSRFEVSRGKKSNAGSGSTYGLVAGTVLGLYVGTQLVEFSECEGSNCNPPEGVVLVGSGLGGALFGLGVGAGIGALIRTERWKKAEARPAP